MMLERPLAVLPASNSPDRHALTREVIRVGAMDTAYVRNRRVKPELAFRLRTRAAVVVAAWRKYGRSESPRLLEVGAAEGRTLVEIARGLGDGEYIGVELNAALIPETEALPSNVQLIEGDATSLPLSLAESSFDVVSFLAVLEHLPNPTAALHEAFRLLRPSGIVVASCPNPFWDAVAGRFRLVQTEHHLQRIGLDRLRTAIEKTGFDILEARRFMWAPIAALPYARIPVSHQLALRLDAVVDRIPLIRRLCVNAYVVARKPGHPSGETLV